MLPPGPRTPRLWQSLRYVVQPVPYVRELQEKYGDVFGLASLAGTGIAVLDPALAKEIFAAPPDTFEAIPLLRAIFGQHAVIATARSEHRRQRKLLNPPFHGARIKALYATMRTVIDRHLLAMRPRDEVRMLDIAQALALDVILETMFGASLDGPMRARGRVLLGGTIHAFDPVLISTTKLHTRTFPVFRRYDDALRRLHAWFDEVIAGRRSTGADHPDLLGLLLAARYEDGAPLTDDELHDQLVTLLLAGHETSATALAWATYWLLREPRVLAAVREETRDLGTDAIVKAPYLGAVVTETLRIEPIVTDVVRICREPFRLGPWTVPARGLVAVMLTTILNDPRVFPEPRSFRPERFLESRTYHVGELLPFGGGTRRCLGATFAEAELAIAIATLANHLDLVLVEKEERSVRRNITMGPARGVRVRVRSVS